MFTHSPPCNLSPLSLLFSRLNIVSLPDKSSTNNLPGEVEETCWVWRLCAVEKWFFRLMRGNKHFSSSGEGRLPREEMSFLEIVQK